MEVSKQDLNCNEEEEIIGFDLIQAVVSLIDLPDEAWVRQELGRLLHESGRNTSELTMEDLRSAVALYLESMQTSLIEEDFESLSPVSNYSS